jgi:alanyl-tRNA synthetase
VPLSRARIDRRREARRFARLLPDDVVAVPLFDNVLDQRCVVARRDGLSQDQLRDLAVSVRNQPGIRGVVLVGTPDGQRVAVVAAVAKDSALVAGELAVAAARATGGGGNAKAADLAVAGGKDVAKIDDALAAVSALLSR